MRYVVTNNTLKYHPNYRRHRTIVRSSEDLLKEALKHIDKYFDLPDKIKISLQPLRGTRLGGWQDMFKTMLIDPRDRNLGSILSTFVHELTHAEQFKQGRLKFVGGDFLWNMTSTPWPRATTFAQYLNLPWEIEARAKQDSLTPLLAQDIIKGWSGTTLVAL